MLPPARLGVVVGPFLGAVIDASDRKRMLISCALVGTAATYVLLVLCKTTWVVALVLSVQGAFAALYPPAINSVSIGLVGPLKVCDARFERVKTRSSAPFLHWHVRTWAAETTLPYASSGRRILDAL